MGRTGPVATRPTNATISRAPQNFMLRTNVTQCVLIEGFCVWRSKNKTQISKIFPSEVMFAFHTQPFRDSVALPGIPAALTMLRRFNEVAVCVWLRYLRS